jgi:hypothetical protein
MMTKYVVASTAVLSELECSLAMYSPGWRGLVAASKVTVPKLASWLRKVSGSVVVSGDGIRPSVYRDNKHSPVPSADSIVIMSMVPAGWMVVQPSSMFSPRCRNALDVERQSLPGSHV